MYSLLFSCSLLGPHFLGMAMSVLHFLYLARKYLWNVGNVWFTFLLYMIVLCMMYVYLYLFVHGWLCTSYDGLSWLHKWPFLVMRALDLVVWVCAQGNCRRCIFMLYCVPDHHTMIVLIHVTKWHWFPHVCDMHQCGWCFEGLRLVTVWACWYTNAKSCWWAIAHQMQNLAGFLLWKWGIPISIFSC